MAPGRIHRHRLADGPVHGAQRRRGQAGPDHHPTARGEQVGHRGVGEGECHTMGPPPTSVAGSNFQGCHGGQGQGLQRQDVDGEEGVHEKLLHNHEHSNILPWRSLLIGMVHGLAGSAALLILTTQIVSSPLVGLIYVGLFGLGSVFGMAALSAFIAIPLSRSATALTCLNRVIQGGVGVWTLLLGAYVIYRHIPDFA